MGINKLRKRAIGGAAAVLLSLIANGQPKLVVQVVVDQMRQEYMQRFADQFDSDGGLRVLLDSGFAYANTHYNYIPTKTGPGHASVSTGTTPKYHGIVANDWLDSRNGYEMYCAEDTTVQPVGTIESSSERSPKNLRALTFSDGIKLYTNGAGKNFGISVKDRGAIFPAGHFADGAFWLDNNMNFVTSSYYMEALPRYVEQYNKKQRAISLMKKDWKLELADRKYQLSLQDENPYEPKLNNGTSSFPYDLRSLVDKKGLSALKNTPVGNTMLLEMALDLIKAEDLGKDEYTDFLGISFSSTDYAGHTWGVRSREVHDMYLKLDKDLGELISLLDKQVGRNNYLLYLTADHAASENPNHLRSYGYDVRNYANADVITELNEEIERQTGISGAVVKMVNHYLYLKDEAKPRLGEIALIAEQTDPFLHVYTAEQIRAAAGGDDLMTLLNQGFQSRFAGDLVFELQPNCIFYGPYGSTHGSGYTYDTHVPFYMLGYGVIPGTSHEKTAVTDIVDKVAQTAKLPLAPNSLVK